MNRSSKRFGAVWRLPRRHLAVTILVLATVGVAAIIWLLSRLHPLPPRAVSLATGPEGSAYAEFGKRYQELLARDGVRLTLVPTAGAVDNARLMADPHSGIQLGFVDGGVATDATGLVSLGTVCYQPLWLFARTTVPEQGLAALRGKRVSIGPQGSETRALTLQLLKLNGADLKAFDVLGLPPAVAASELMEGQIDAAALLTSWDSPLVRRLLEADDVRLITFPRVDAYVALFPFLNKLVVPQGLGDLAKNVPPQDVTLLATKTSLVVRRDLHPALQYLLLETAAQIHSKAGIFQKPSQFPAPEPIDITLSSYAQDFYKSGRPYLQQWLPFWLAVIVEQALVVLLPMLGVAYPVMKGLAALYDWGVKRRILHMYGELWLLQNALERADDDHAKSDLLSRLTHLQQRASRLRVPSSFMPMLYLLRNHIEAVVTRLADPGHEQT